MLLSMLRVEEEKNLSLLFQDWIFLELMKNNLQKNVVKSLHALVQQPKKEFNFKETSFNKLKKF